MAQITQLTRYKSKSDSSLLAAAKQAKAIFKKYGVDMRVSSFNSGSIAGEWLVTTRYSDWAAYGKVQEALAKDPAYKKFAAKVSSFAQVTSRYVLVDADI